MQLTRQRLEEELSTLFDEVKEFFVMYSLSLIRGSVDFPFFFLVLSMCSGNLKLKMTH